MLRRHAAKCMNSQQHHDGLGYLSCDRVPEMV
jgi:hypothetical protein